MKIMNTMKEIILEGEKSNLIKISEDLSTITYINQNVTRNFNNPEEKIQLAMDFETNVKKDDIIKETIENIDVLNTTPIEALNVLFDLKQKIKKGD